MQREGAMRRVEQHLCQPGVSVREVPYVPINVLQRLLQNEFDNTTVQNNAHHQTSHTQHGPLRTAWSSQTHPRVTRHDISFMRKHPFVFLAVDAHQKCSEARWEEAEKPSTKRIWSFCEKLCCCQTQAGCHNTPPGQCQSRAVQAMSQSELLMSCQAKPRRRQRESEWGMPPQRPPSCSKPMHPPPVHPTQHFLSWAVIPDEAV